MTGLVPCAGAVVLDAQRRLLVVRRRNPPGAGLWSIPGGRCLPGETAADACVREVREETGLSVRLVRHVGAVTRPSAPSITYLIDDYLCEVVGGTLLAADDATDARWCTADELAALELVPELEDTLRGWKLWPA